MTRSATFRSRPAAEPDTDPFRLGWRWVRPASTNGTPGESRQVPLTADDLLHPQEGDQIPENTTQERDRTYLTEVLRLRLGDRPRMRVLSDCLVDWGIRGLRRHSPDISVFDRLRDPAWQGGMFRVARQQARPVLVIEIVSPDAGDPQVRENDVVTKVQHYYRARVPLYAIIDREVEGGPRRLVGYRRGPGGYVALRPDDHGRLPLKPVGLLLGLRDNVAVCYDLQTEEEIPDLAGMARARAAAQADLADMARAREATEAALAEAQARIKELEAKARRRKS